MVYHAKLTYDGSNSHFWWNHSKENLIQKLIIPFVNGQVVLVTLEGRKRLLNMKNVSLLTIFKTATDLKGSDSDSIVKQIQSKTFLENECTAEIMAEAKIGEAPRNMTSLLEKALQPPKEQAFVIMKFGDATLDSAYEGAYKLIVEQFGLKCVRIDEIENSGRISEQILEKIAESKYVIADLSGGRPNCYYECGFAHALGKELILSAHKDELVHFDLANNRFIQWDTESDLRRKLKQRLKALENSGGKSEQPG